LTYDRKLTTELLAAHWSQAWHDFDSRLRPATDNAAQSAQGLLSVVLPAAGAEFAHADDAFGVAALQELGEGYALLTERWPIGDLEEPTMPNRQFVESLIARAGPTAVEELGQQGVCLSTPGSDALDRATASRGKMPRRVERDLARNTASDIGWYRRYLELWSHERGRRIFMEHASRVRRDSCGILATARDMFYAQAVLDDHGGIARGATFLIRLISDSKIVASLAADTDELARTPYLTRESLESHIETLRIDEWLRHHGVSVPAPA